MHTIKYDLIHSYMHTMRRRQKRASGDSRMEIMESNLRSQYSRKFIKSICKKILNKTTFVKDDILTFACSTVEFSYDGITDRFNLLLFVLELVNLKISRDLYVQKIRESDVCSSGIGNTKSIE